MSDVKRYQIGGRDIPASAAVFLPSEVVSSADYEAKRKGWIEQHARDSAELRRLCKERDQLRAELEAIRGQQAVATLLPSDPCDERHGFYLSLEDKQRLADLPAGTKLYALPPQQPDAVSVPRELLESHLQQVGEYSWDPDSVGMLRALLSTKNAEEV